MFTSILVWGIVVGVAHFIVVGVLYMNPLVARIYKEAWGHAALRVWENQREYLIKMFAGTQVEIFVLTGAYLYLRRFFPDPGGLGSAVVIACILSATRVYPRFWNMLIQTTYPFRLLIVELVNGTIGTFVVVLALWLLPVAP